jgi:hypothetical protein
MRFLELQYNIVRRFDMICSRYSFGLDMVCGSLYSAVLVPRFFGGPTKLLSAIVTDLPEVYLGCHLRLSALECVVG